MSERLRPDTEYTLRYTDMSDGEEHEDNNQPLRSVLYALASSAEGAVRNLVIESQDGEL